ncbi:MAG: extracellular solute-binding protein, partial [bacterium]|nr:extracellular solute-binding protein [bacterium]
MKKYISIMLSLVILTSVFCFSGCGSTNDVVENLEGEYTTDLSGTELNVFNWGEYISDGSEGMLDINAAFEKLTGIKVNYSNYESNETMYSKLKSGATSYDIIIPSDYMIQRLIREDMLTGIDTSKLTNYKYIAQQYKNLYFDPDNKYSVPYNVGMVGLIYNTQTVKETPKSWAIMWDEQYKDQILSFNNSRDAFAI